MRIMRDSVVYTPVSLEPDTDDDEETLVDTEVYNNDLAQIRALVESSGIEVGGSICPSCGMPFDKGKKRRLIDACGHERCYSCLFRSEACPLCMPWPNEGSCPITSTTQLCTRPSSEQNQDSVPENDYSTFTDDALTLTTLCSSPRPRLKGNRITVTQYMQANSSTTPVQSTRRMAPRAQQSSAVDTPPPPRCCSPTSQQRKLRSALTQSCPTPPQQRRRFFLNSKVLKSPFAQKACGSAASQQAREQQQHSDNPSALSDDEGGSVKPLSSKTRKTSQSDLYMRLGLLLGAGHSRGAVSGSALGSRPSTRLNDSRSHDSSAASFSSLTSFDTQPLPSTNTSPVSTLTTGTSSEAEVAHRAISAGGRGKGKAKDCDSVASLASTSMSVSGRSNGSSCSPPLTPRRHSVTTAQPGQVEELTLFKNRRSCARRSARTGAVKGPVDPRIRFAQYRTAQLILKPLFFEVPLLEVDPPFTGRQWLLHELETVINGSSSGALIYGSPGTGKTAVILQLVEHSCFGRRRERIQSNRMYEDVEETAKDKSIDRDSQPNVEASLRATNDKIRELASHVVAYHFCQADNNNTCLVPELIHSLAAQLCQAPQLVAYREYLLSEPHLQGSLSQRECTVDPDLALSRGIIEPLVSLRKAERLPDHTMVILIDAICEAEYHRPDRGDTVASFLSRHATNFPSWLKIICTVRVQLLECAKHLPYTRIPLDRSCKELTSSDGNITKDLANYVNYRLIKSLTIQANVTATVNGKTESSCGATQTKFASHLLALSKGSFLFAKLTLDLIESGHLVAKSAGYKVLPVSLAQIFQLHFNLRFPTATSFDKVQPLLGVCLAALYPMTMLEIFYSVNSLHTEEFISWDDFLQRFKMLSGFLVKRLDNTYMFFHPSFREWLMRRDENESTKFLCDLRLGHAGIAFRLSRHQAPLDGDQVLELGHHVLKAHVYRGVAPCWPSRDLQAVWLASSAESVSAALCTLRNIYSPNVKVSRLLLLAGASPNHTTEYLGQAPALCMYAHEGSVEMVSLLLEFGADVGLTNSQGCTALSLAAARGHCDVVRRLAAAGSSLGRADMAGQCPLVHAARHGRLAVVGYLLACDWPIVQHSQASKNLIPLPQCVEVSREEAVQQAAVTAAAQGHEEILEYLLDMAEVTIDRMDTLTGETALTIAAAHGSTATVSALLSRGAEPTATNAKGLSPLMLAAREGHWGTAERLLQGSLSCSSAGIMNDEIVAPLLHQRDSVGRTSLMIAAAEGHSSLIELFLDKGSALEAIDKEGLTALGWACVRGRVSAVQLLLDRGAQVTTTDGTGRTPLDLAAFQGNPNLVQMLLERGAAVEHVDLHGMRPLDRAIGCRNIPVIQCFLRRGAKLGPATWAMATGKPDVLLILLNKLLEDGNILYRKGRLKEASHRYGYALRKFPSCSSPTTTSYCSSAEDGDYAQHQNNLQLHQATFAQLRINFLLNLSRCKRKMNEYEEAIELADEALKTRPDSYEAFYARAKARFEAKLFEHALVDVQEALKIAPPHNRQVRRVLVCLRDEINSRRSCQSQDDGAARSCSTSLRASVDTLTEL